MALNRILFSSASDDWSTPADLFDSLNDEFGFIDDPCPITPEPGGVSGLMREWKSPCYVNPPYSDIFSWMEKAMLEYSHGKTVVLLVPARTDTKWWHTFAMKASEIRFIKGRLKFGGAKNSAPFPSAIVIFRSK